MTQITETPGQTISRLEKERDEAMDLALNRSGDTFGNAFKLLFAGAVSGAIGLAVLSTAMHRDKMMVAVPASSDIRNQFNHIQSAHYEEKLYEKLEQNLTPYIEQEMKKIVDEWKHAPVKPRPLFTVP